MQRKRYHASRRDGVASLELVMSAPILMFLIAMLYTLYIATMMKSQLTMEVRHTAWLPRTQAINGSLPFSVTQAHATGKSTKELSRRVRVYRNWYPSVPRDIRWGNVVLTGSWDHREVSFQNGFVIYPHLSVLTQMVAAQGGVPAKSGDITNLGDLTKIPGL